MEKSRDALPTRYLLKIESFSLLSQNGISKYESNEFESSGFNWKMIIHPDGDGDGQGHISAYLVIIGKSSLHAVWDVNASFSFLIYDQIHDKFTVTKGMERRFCNIKTKWGFSKCISHETFKDPSNGYLVNDKCVFGVDVYVIKNQRIGECLSLLNDTEPYKHEWKITEFSKLKNEVYYSEGYAPRKSGQSNSVFLASVANFSISVKNQTSGKHRKMSAASYRWGWRSFMPSCGFNDPKKGFLIEPEVIIRPSKLISNRNMGEVSRDALPTRYLLTIESFSLLSQNGISKYESNEFEYGGFNWKMIIYPDGDGDGAGHISVYLSIIGPSSLHAVCEMKASFSFLIFDQIHDNFNVMKGMERRFRNIKTEWGFSKCISHETFKDPCNGYLVNDKCVFGVDVYVIKNHGIGECMSLLNGTKPYKHEWKITEFSKLKNEVYYSEEFTVDDYNNNNPVFTVDDYKWKLSIYPTGDNRQNGRNISIYLESVDAKGFDRHKRVKAKFSISVKNQISGEHYKKSGGANWYSVAESGWGWPLFMACCEFNDPKKGFLIEDCCIVEADVSVVGVVNCLT